MTSTEIKFLEKIKNTCRSQLKINKILASVTAAQAIYESNWGSKEFVKDTNNLYRILVDDTWTGMCYSLDSKELYESKSDCRGTETLIRVYDNYDQCIEDFIQYVLNERRSENGPFLYRNVVGITDYTKCVKTYIRDGYIEKHLFDYNDPTYESNIIGIIEKYELFNWDDVTDIDAIITKYYVKALAADTAIFVDTNKANAITVASGNRGYKVFDQNNNVVVDPWIVDEKTPMYRVRLEWDKPATQIGATKILADAKTTASTHTGYKVFEGEAGKLIYNPWEKIDVGVINNNDPTPTSVIVSNPGDIIKLNNRPVYKTATASNPFIFLTGTYYLFDGKIINGRARITKTNDPKVINGKDPSKIIGFILI